MTLGWQMQFVRDILTVDIRAASGQPSTIEALYAQVFA